MHAREMGLRDYFAGQALVGYLATYNGPKGKFPDKELLAADCYDVADKMLAARDRPWQGKDDDDRETMAEGDARYYRKEPRS